MPSGLEIRLEGTTRVPPDLADKAAAEFGDLGDPGDALGHLPVETLVAFGTGLPLLTPEIDDALNAELQHAADELDVPELAALESTPANGWLDQLRWVRTPGRLAVRQMCSWSLRSAILPRPARTLTG